MPTGRARSTITRDQPIDMLPIRVISPLRTYQSVPFTSRTCGDADADVLDDARGEAQVDDVADADLVLGDDEDAVEHVLDDVLRAEAEAGADRGGEQGERGQGVRGEHVDDEQQRRR